MFVCHVCAISPSVMSRLEVSAKYPRHRSQQGWLLDDKKFLENVTMQFAQRATVVHGVVCYLCEIISGGKGKEAPESLQSLQT